MKKFFITTIALFSLLLSVGTAQGQLTNDTCRAQFYLDPEFTQTTDSAERTAGTANCIGPQMLYVAFPTPKNFSMVGSDILLWGQPAATTMRWFNLSEWGNGVTVSTKIVRGVSYLYAQIPLPSSRVCEASVKLNNIKKNAIEVKARFNGQDCGAEYSIPVYERNATCEISVSACVRQNQNFDIKAQVRYSNFNLSGKYYVGLSGTYKGDQYARKIAVESPSGLSDVVIFENIDYKSQGEQSICVADGRTNIVGTCDNRICNIPFIAANEIDQKCEDGHADPTTPSGGGMLVPFQLCSQVLSHDRRDGTIGTPAFDSCLTCFESGGMWTALGCIPLGSALTDEGGVTYNVSSTVRAIIQLGLGIGGGVVILMLLAAGFILSTSQGDPNRVKEAKEMVTSAVMGLVFVIFSITILRFIGIRLLQIPGFGG